MSPFFLGDQHFVNQGILEGTGKFEVENWENAVDRASLAHPGSSVVLKRRGLNTSWVPGGNTPKVSHYKSSWTGQDSEGIDFPMTNLCPFKGPVCEIILLDCPDKQRVILNTLHTAIDGIGTVIWGMDIFRVLQGKEPIGSTSLKTDMDVASSFKVESKPNLKISGVSPFPGNSSADETGFWIRKTIPKITPRIITKLCKAVFDVTQEFNSGPVRMMIPVDLRRKAVDVTSIGNLVGNIFIDIKAGDDHKSLYLQLLQKIKNNEECYIPTSFKLARFIPTLMVTGSLRDNDKKNLKKGIYPMTGVVTHLNNIKAEQAVGGGFHGQSWISINSMSGPIQPPLFVSISEWRTDNSKHTNFVFGAPKKQATKEMLENFAASVLSAV